MSNSDKWFNRVKYPVLIFLMAAIISQTGCSKQQVQQFFSAECISTRYVNDRYKDYPYTKYQVKALVQTDDGVGFDDSGFVVDSRRIDKETAEVEDCLGIRIDRCAFRVKVAPDWYVHECSGRQQFPCAVPDFATPDCENRETCKCGCTGIVQYPSIIITTPNLASFKHELIHVVTRIADHGNEVFKCQ